MKIIDISWPIEPEMTVYKDKPEKKPRLTWLKQYDKDKVYESQVELENHTGTHVDAPKHFLQDGASIDTVPVDNLIGPCTVIEINEVKITKEVLEKVQITQDIVLFKTKNSELSATGNHPADFVYLDKTGAEYLASKNIKAVGIDYLGIERDQPEHETHTILLSRGIPIIEGLRLQHVTAGKYEFVCLPLKIKGAEAAPARAILIHKQ